MKDHQSNPNPSSELRVGDAEYRSGVEAARKVMRTVHARLIARIRRGDASAIERGNRLVAQEYLQLLEAVDKLAQHFDGKAVDDDLVAFDCLLKCAASSREAYLMLREFRAAQAEATGQAAA